ncbi:MAG: AEC family transporter, partial [Rhizobiaceae bacterium]
MFIQILNVLAPVIIITAIGYILGRSSLGIHTSTLSLVTILVATPALIFSKLTAADIDQESLWLMASAAALCVAISASIAVIFLKIFGGSINTYLASLIMPNSGNVGLPLVLLTFGEENLHLGVSFFFVIALLQHSVGASVTAGSYQFSFLFKQPLIYAVICVIAVVATGVTVPEIVLTTTGMLGGMMIPAMLI